MSTEITVSSGTSVNVTAPSQSSIEVQVPDNESITVSEKGAKGDKGEVGATGATGAAGADGAAGPTYTVSCVDGDNSDEEKIRLTASTGTTDDVVLEAGTGMTISRSGDKITFTNAVTDTDTVLSAEQVQDIVGAMFSSNTETRISATYQDGDGTIDLVVDDMTANDNTQNTYAISCVDGDNSDEEKIRLTQGGAGGASTDDIVLEAGTGLSVARSGDKITFTNTVTDTNTTELSTDSSPQLGGDLDVNGNDIVSTSNGDIDINPNGSGKVVIDSASASSGVKVSDGHVEIFSGTGSAGKVDFYCESSAAHKVTVQSPAHSAFSGDVQFTLPASNGSDGQVLKTDGSGNLSYVNQTTDTQLSTEQVQDITGAMFSSNTESGITATYQDGDGTIDLEVGSLTVAQGGTGATSFADKAVLITQDSGTDTVAAATMSTNGQLLIGGTSGPAVGTLTAGSNVTITNSDGAITIASSGGGGGGTGIPINYARLRMGATVISGGGSQQDFNSASFVIAKFDTEEDNDGSELTVDTSNNKVTVGSDGLYRLTANMTFTATTARITPSISFNVNGSRIIGESYGYVRASNGSNENSCNITRVIALSASDYVNVCVHDTSTVSGSVYSTEAIFEVEKLGAGGDVVNDTTPQLGGNLDVNGNKITSASNGDIDIEPNGTGNVLLGNFKFDVDQTVGSGQDNHVLTYDHSSGDISLEAASGGSVNELDGQSVEYLTRSSAYGNNTWEGEVIKFGSDTLVQNKFYVHTSSGWVATDADVEAKTKGLFGIALGTSSATNGLLVKGIHSSNAHSFSAGDTLYIGTTEGAVTATAPSGSGDFVRVVGQVLANGYIYINPSPDYIELA